jgi:hypothetical protein
MTDTRFKKGAPRIKGSGRAKGSKNKVTMALKDAIILAAEETGFKKWNRKTKKYDRCGGDLAGYLRHLALRKEELFAPLLGKVLPTHVLPATVENRVYRTEEEVRALCAETGIPFESMIEIAVPIPRHMLDVTPDDTEGDDGVNGLFGNLTLTNWFYKKK